MPKEVISRAFYAVRRGHECGIYKTWGECQKQIEGFKFPHFRKFTTYEEAQAFIKDGKVKEANGKTKHDRSKSSKHDAVIATNKNNTKASISSSGTATTAQENEIKPDEIVYTDGAAPGNGKKGAKAGYGVFWGPEDPRNEGGPLQGEKQTNQRGELTAVLRALEQSAKGTKSLEIRTDSQYTINCVETWSIKWIKNGWKASNGKPVDNRDLVEKILKLKNTRPGKVWMSYVKGHSGDFGNDNADRLAVEGARLGRIVKNQ
ncbi:ribonuclease H Rnh1 [Phascolomyces articulosus]|uniref:Ribonuclease H n=1 Tax=Phascolomyces articulosus TaxID=60185 RepID=A0AAD5K379_9FUNG|nr:ribonuclease H Rnh1 [Phascolomyces articulosus]